MYDMHPLFLAPEMESFEMAQDTFMDLYSQLTFEEMSQLAHQPQDFIVNCTLAKANISQCDQFIRDGGIKVYTPLKGICYAFNLAPEYGSKEFIPLDAQYSGYEAGLEMVFNLESKYEYV